MTYIIKCRHAGCQSIRLHDEQRAQEWARDHQDATGHRTDVVEADDVSFTRASELRDPTDAGDHHADV